MKATVRISVETEVGSWIMRPRVEAEEVRSTISRALLALEAATGVWLGSFPLEVIEQMVSVEAEDAER